jgi:hypothetical protein
MKKYFQDLGRFGRYASKHMRKENLQRLRAALLRLAPGSRIGLGGSLANASTFGWP